MKRANSIIEIFKKQVMESPNNVGLVTDFSNYSYDEIDKNSDKVADELLRNNVVKGDFISVIMHRSEKMLFAILGILKVGAVYVPISREFPEERTDYILKDTDSKIVIVDGDINLNNTIFTLVANDDFFKRELNSKVSIPLINGDDPLYCIYTSGTTGVPKGVVNTNLGCINRISWMQEEYPINNNDRILQKTNYIFDVSVWELFWWFFTGASCVLLEDGEQGNPEKIYRKIIEEKITVTHFVPTMLSEYLNYLEDNSIEDSSNLKWIFSSGEPLLPEYSSRFYKLSKGTLVNLYGPTEASIDVTHYKVSGEESQIPIGVPIKNMQVVIADPKTLKICDEGKKGEIFILGVGLAKGYLNNPAKNAEAFLNNPFGTGRAYRTGDFGYVKNGLIYYVGRKDDQIKINGYRVDLNEILFHLKKFDSIDDVRIIYTKEVVNTLKVYFISKEKIEEESIRNYLQTKLPKYMVPHEYYQLDKFPITLNGKLDKKKLLELSNSKLKYLQNYTDKLDEKQKAIYNSLALSLGKQDIDLNNNYISLGGDSMKAIRAVSILRKNGFNCTIKQILTSNKIIDLCQNIVEDTSEFEDDITPYGSVIDTPIIKLFKKYQMQHPGHFNQIRSKTEENLNVGQIKKVLFNLARIHPELTAIFLKNGTLTIENSPFSNLEIIDRRSVQELDWKKELDKLLTDGKLEFHSNEQLFKVVVFEMSNKCLLLFIAHHLIIDEISWKNIFDDFDQLGKNILINSDYEDHKTVGTSFRSWSYFLESYKKDFVNSSEFKYWKNLNEEFFELNKNLNQLTITEVAEPVVNITQKISSISSLKKIIDGSQYTILDLILLLLKKTLQKIKNIEKVPLLVESHGRHDFSGKLRIENTVGWFTSFYPLILTKESTTEEGLFKIHQQIKSIPNDGIGYGISFDNLNFIMPHFLFNFFGEITEDNNIQYVKDFFKYEKNEINFINMHPMKIDVMILNGDVTISIEAQQRFYSQKVLKKIVDEIISETLKLENTEVNEVKIEVDEGIDFDDFSNILDKFN